ncbi:MAG: hypothetical protein QM736_26495 [Vicinamibacterales bacterium]
MIALIGAMLSFQIGASIAKQLMPVIGAPGTTALRIGISALMLLAVQRPWRTLPERRHLPLLVAYGLSLGTMNFVFYQAIRTDPAGDRRRSRVHRAAGGCPSGLAPAPRFPVARARRHRCRAVVAALDGRQRRRHARRRLRADRRSVLGALHRLRPARRTSAGRGRSHMGDGDCGVRRSSLSGSRTPDPR